MKKDISNLIYVLLMILVFGLSSVFGQKITTISLTTDNYPTETYWILMADSLYGDTIADVQAGHYTQMNTNYIDTCYIPDTVSTIVFLLRDTYGDGMSGSYYVAVCEDTIISKPTVTFQNGIYQTRQVPQCLPNPPPPPPGPCVPTLVQINLDQYGGETSWDIQDTLGNTMFSNGPYTNAPDYQPQNHIICLPVGEFVFTIYDSYGDGMAGSQWGGNDGSYYVIQCGDTLVYGDVANFGTDSGHVLLSDTCVPPPPVPGCMDENYVEYNPSATVSDSSCATLKIYGCTDSTMFNYDSLANTMDYVDSCSFSLTLHDLAGNGWVGSRLEVYQDDTTQHVLMSGFSQTTFITLNAPEEVRFKFFINQQASMTALECGFTLINPFGDTVINVQPPFIQPFFVYTAQTYCGNECIEKVYGCLDTLAWNYDSLANMSDDCYYYPGCTSPAYLEYHADTANGYYSDYNVQDSCQTLAVFGCMDSLAFNYDSTANVDNGGCLPVVYGCMDAFAFNFNPLANTPDTCIPFIYGCLDPTAFNYCDTCNTDNGDCEPFVFGCMDSTMFNFNPLANADNGSCIPFIFGCTDPSMLNYNPQANTEDFSCIPYVYGCMDSLALNYDPLANTDNGSCIEAVVGCMDTEAYNYDSAANISNIDLCLYDAGCITGPGNPYWLNNDCYAWVIAVDNYCCDNEWDNICQLTYNYCEDTWVGPQPPARFSLDDVNIYPNPSSDKIYITKNVDFNVYNITGDIIISETNKNVLDVSYLIPGIYNIQIIYNDIVINKKIIKQ